MGMFPESKEIKWLNRIPNCGKSRAKLPGSGSLPCPPHAICSSGPGGPGSFFVEHCSGRHL